MRIHQRKSPASVLGDTNYNQVLISPFFAQAEKGAGGMSSWELEDCSSLRSSRSSLGNSPKKKPRIRLRRLLGSFYFYPSHEQAQLGLKIKNPGATRQGFFFVDKRLEISNMSLF